MMPHDVTGLERVNLCQSVVIEIVVQPIGLHFDKTKQFFFLIIRHKDRDVCVSNIIFHFKSQIGQFICSNS
jgi:hypothetical protein